MIYITDANGKLNGTRYTNKEFEIHKAFHIERGELYIDWDELELDYESLPTITESELLSVKKIIKIESIDTQTSKDIELIVGDNNKQKSKLAEFASLQRLEFKATITTEQTARLNELEGLYTQVEDLKTLGNEREVLCSNATTILELEAIWKNF